MHEGSGLGLSVVHGIVSSCGGRIHVESEVGEGTTFDVYFPRLPREERARPEPSPAPPRGTEHVLVVDDEAAIIDVVTRMLSGLGYRVTSTMSSLEALEMFRREPDAFDLVLTDQALPHMTGAALTTEMKAIRADVRVIMCTGYSDVLDDKKAKLLGARALLTKPVDLRTLAFAVRGALDEA